MAAKNELLERRRAILGDAPLFYDEPLELVRGEGTFVWDAQGRRYLDAYNNVPHVGHCHPRVIEALARQAGQLNIHTRYLHETTVHYAERLASTFDASLSRVIFTCTGTEANELALRIARTTTGAMGVIVSSFNYHGNSSRLAELTTGLPAPEPFATHARAVQIPDPYRGENLGLEAFSEAVAALQAEGFGLAAVLLDSIFSTEGLLEVPAGWLAGVAEITRRAGGLLIADEVQAGFGRMGDAMWGHVAHGVIPDMVTLGKPMGNGHPVAGVVTRADLGHAFAKRALYFNTFGGNPVSSAVGLAVLDVLRDEDLIARAAATGARLKAGLTELKSRHALIGDIRGRGLFQAAELVRDRTSQEADSSAANWVVNAMKREGVLISRTGPKGNVLKIRPPLSLTTAQAETLLDTLDACFTEVSDR